MEQETFKLERHKGLIIQVPKAAKFGQENNNPGKQIIQARQNSRDETAYYLLDGYGTYYAHVLVIQLPRQLLTIMNP